MDTRCRSRLVILILFCFALTSYAQHVRFSSVTITGGETNNGGFYNAANAGPFAAPAAGRLLLFPSNDSWFQLTSAGVLTDLAAGGGSLNAGKMLFVDSVNGNNTTGTRGVESKPFLDPKAAVNAALSGDTIIVRPGTYDTNDLWKGGVSWYFLDGASLEFTDPGAGSGRGLFDDRADPGTVCIVDGFGRFKHLQGNFTGNLKGAFVVTNAASRLYARGRRLEYDAGPAAETAGFALENGTNYIDFTEAEHLGNGGGRSIYFRNGFTVINIDYNLGFDYCLYAHEVTNSTGQIHYSGKFWKQHPDSGAQSAIWARPNNIIRGNQNFIVSGHLDRLESVSGNSVAYVGRFFLSIDESYNTLANVMHEFNYGAEVHLNIQRVRGVGQQLVWQMPEHTNSAVIRVEEWRYDGSAQPMMIFDGGVGATVTVDGQYMRAANGKGIRCSSNGVVRIKNYRIDTSPTDDANNNPIYLSANAANVTLENVILQAPPLADSIRGTNTMSIAGTLQVNNPPSPTMTFNSGILIQNTNVTVFGNTLLVGAATAMAPVVTSNSLRTVGAVFQNGPLMRTPAKTVSGVLSVTGTNYYSIAANTNFEFSFSGTPTNGQLISLLVSNFNTTADIIMTNLAGIYWPRYGSNVNLFAIASNSIAFFNFRYTTNFTAAGQWYVETDSGMEWSLLGSGSVSFLTNGATRQITAFANTNTGAYYVQTVNLKDATITNNITYLSTNMIPSGNATNFAGTYLSPWNTYLMTNAFRLTGMIDVAAANLGRAWIAKLRNLNGSALRVSVDAGFRRAGTNDVSVGNNQNCDVLVTPDGTGGVNPTNHTVQIILYDSP